jgi:tRNA-splicing ligase RtcB (3'-phosphate/5'-hydroxy nucleic acid ligase)
MSMNFEKIGVNTYRLEKLPGMEADAIFYASDDLLPLVTRDRSLKQLTDTAKLPHLMSPVLGMPDMHEGYGIPVGGIIASDKIVSAGAVGMDINCGVRLLRTGVDYDTRLFDERGLVELVHAIEQTIPVGLGGEYAHQHEGISLEQTTLDGARHLVEQGYGRPEDLTYCEEEGRIADADPGRLSNKSKKRARRQIGTLGSGNHFLEIQRVSRVFDEDIAEAFGLHEGLICFMIHSGSRALGHQTCIDYSKKFANVNRNTHPELVPTKNLASALVDSTVGQDYLYAMNAAINFAFANRQMMTHQFRQAFSAYLESRGITPDVELVYDVAHNSAKWEMHRDRRVLVHRKGATRALPAGHPDNPTAYQQFGHPAFVPGSMGTPSYVLVGTDKAAATFFSVNHGAGRAMSRKAARRNFSEADFIEQMRGIVYNKPYKAIADEAPKAYKDVEAVIDTLVAAGITTKVVQLTPLAVIKGD